MGDGLCSVLTAHPWIVNERHVHCYAGLKQASKRKILPMQMDDLPSSSGLRCYARSVSLLH